MTATAQLESPQQPAALPSNNMYLQGNFAPVEREITVGELAVRGALPPELSGSLLRNGPNPAAAGANHHWFVGDGMLHAIQLERGRAVGYRNRWIRTQKIEQALGLPAAPLSPTDAAPGFGAGSISVVQHAGRLLAPGEVGLPFEINAQADTLRQYDFDGALRTSMTGHPKIDPRTGEMFFFGYDFGPVNLRYHVADAQGRLTKTLELPTKGPTMMHDFAVTATRAVFFDLPVVFDLQLIAQGHTMPFRWDDDYGARIGVMRRDGDGSDLRWIEIPACYVYHVFNAYDDGERIVVDLVEHAYTFRDSRIGPDRLYEPPAARWVIDPEHGSVTRTVLDTRGQEFPRIDPRKGMQKHRYGYAVERPYAETGPSKLLKHDFTRGTSEVHELPPGCLPGEGVFAPIGAGEDEGFVLAQVYESQTGRSHVRVIDAQKFAGEPVAVVELPVRMPFGFHGDWVQQ
ncbi:MAG TPA: carotenoid oxygenase family protein [Polyangiales bacterium]|nr:carotenoid oxygenase family protein [Polyangiales bacterium]